MGPMRRAVLFGVGLLTAWCSIVAEGDHYARTYGLGGSTTDFANSIRLAADGLIVVGATDYFLTPPADHDPWVLKLGIWGSIDWQQSFPVIDQTEEFADAVETTPDNGVVVAGCIQCGSSAADFWVVKLDHSGAPLWQYRYGGASLDHASSILQSKPQGAILVTGRSGSDILLLKLDSSGTLLWQKRYGGGNTEDVPYILQTDDDADGSRDDGFVIVAHTGSFGAGSIDVWLLKLDSTGGVQWQRTYGGPGADRSEAIRQTADGGFLIAGSTDSSGSGSNDAWLLKLSSAGAIAWQKTYGGSGDDRAEDLDLTADGSVVVVGRTRSGLANYDGWIFKLDSADPTGATVEWSYLYGGTDDDHFASIVADGNEYVATGQTEYLSIPIGTPDLWVVRTDSDGTIENSCSSQVFTPRVMPSSAIAIEPTGITVDEPPVSATPTSVPARDDRNVTRQYQCKDIPTEPCGCSRATALPIDISGDEKGSPVRFLDKETLVWENKEFNGADSFNLYRGVVSGLGAANYGHCLQANIPVSEAADPSVPTGSTVFCYVVTARNVAGEGTMGFDSSETMRPNTNPCP